MSSRPVIRALAWIALAGQAIFIASWVVAGALEPHYSHVEQAISELGAVNAAHPWIVNAGLVVAGVSLAALAPALLLTLRRSPAARIAATLFVLAGVAWALEGVFQLDCRPTLERACALREDAGRLSREHYAHLWLSLVFQLAFVATPFALAAALRRRPPGLLALGAGVAGIAIAAAVTVAFLLGAPEGAVQRLGLMAVHAWVLIVAVGLLFEARGEPRASEPTPMPPREFFGTAWSGEGEATLWPPFAWRRAPLRFGCRRESTWISDEVWYFDDLASFPDGSVERRRRFCQLLSPERIHITSDDTPDGVDVALTEDGFRVFPYRLLVPAGPARIPLRCRDRSWVEPGGVFVEQIDLSWLGLPAGRVVMRVRPEPGTPT